MSKQTNSMKFSAPHGRGLGVAMGEERFNLYSLIEAGNDGKHMVIFFNNSIHVFIEEDE